MSNMSNLMNMNNDDKKQQKWKKVDAKLLGRLDSLIENKSSTEKTNDDKKVFHTYYPAITDKHFNAKLYNHPLFSKYKYPDVKQLFCESSQIIRDK